VYKIRRNLAYSQIWVTLRSRNVYQKFVLARKLSYLKDDRAMRPRMG